MQMPYPDQFWTVKRIKLCLLLKLYLLKIVSHLMSCGSDMRDNIVYHSKLKRKLKELTYKHYLRYEQNMMILGYEILAAK